jgi:predicted PurR-regulated permease PerM
MKSQYFIAVLFAAALYFMYYLYAPFLMVMTIAALLAISTASIHSFFEEFFHSKLLAALISSTLLAVMFFAPLGYFLATLTIKLNTLEVDTLIKVQTYIKDFISHPPEYLNFLKPYLGDNFVDIDIKTVSATALSIAAKIGAFSAVFVKNAFLVIVFYFFAQYNGTVIVEFFKRIVHMSPRESEILSQDLSSVMSVVFYSIIATATFEGALFGIAVSFLGHNGLLYGIMYGFSSLIPVVGGVLMWLPFMIYEFATGHSSNAIFIALYSVIVIAIIADTFIKPMIIKEINNRLLKEGESSMNELIIFFAIIAGLTTFGFWGMILGPAITAFFLTILKLFEARSNECDESLNSCV